MTQYINSSHDVARGGSSATVTTGRNYIPHPSETGLCATRTCIRCGARRAMSQLVTDKRFRHQVRCAGGCTKQGAQA